ncbi:MAG: polyprenyl synthetase family protein [Muribaculaceae bacterium]|nr:polyprenyl synthetase family protein [Muribaculaceae bacterium]
MESLQQYVNYINEAVALIKYPSKPSGLYEPIAYTISGGGKRIRPVLLLAACEALGGLKEDAINQAVGLEMFHNFTLLHDDVMDKADIRRGRSTVHVKWNESTAILSGDAMLTMASMLMSRCAGDKLERVTDLFNRTAMEIYEGQQYDMDFEARLDVSVEEYVEMIRLKTSVLLGCACELGAIMAGGDDLACKAFYKYGISLGLAFQLQDDWLDTYGDMTVFGKNIGGDILNDKKTFLLITALANADECQRNKMLSLIGTRSEEKINTIRCIYDNLHVAEKCRELIDYYAKEATDALEVLNLPAETRTFFSQLADDLRTRNS